MSEAIRPLREICEHKLFDEHTFPTTVDGEYRRFGGRCEGGAWVWAVGNLLVIPCPTCILQGHEPAESNPAGGHLVEHLICPTCQGEGHVEEGAK